MYIVKEGEVECLSGNSLIRILTKGDYFGEKSILLGTKRSKDIIAKTDCICYSISKETLKSMIGKKYRETLYFNFMKMAISESTIFRKFNLKLLDKAITYFKIKHFTKNETVIEAGHVISSSIVILIQGNLINVDIIINSSLTLTK